MFAEADWVSDNRVNFSLGVLGFALEHPLRNYAVVVAFIGVGFGVFWCICCDDFY